MKKNLFALFALICSMSLFTACSDDDDPVKEPTLEDKIEQVVGTYNGSMDIYSVTAGGNAPISSGVEQDIQITKGSSNTISLSLKDFSIDLGKGPIEVGDISVSNCAVTESGSGIAFTGSASMVVMQILPCTVSVEGTVSNSGALSMNINVNVSEGTMNVLVNYTGTKE